MANDPTNEEMPEALSALLRKVGVKRPEEEVGEERKPNFVLDRNWVWQKRREKERKKAAHRQSMKPFIRPENADEIVAQLPEPGGATHCVLNGNFVLADLMPRMLGSRRCPHLRVATLSMSMNNAETLTKMMLTGSTLRETVVLSHYFAEVNKEVVFSQIRAKLQGHAQLVVTRSHAKVILMPTEPEGDKPGDWWVVEGSANLRSSDNLEQITIFNDRELHDFHAGWIDELAGKTNLG